MTFMNPDDRIAALVALGKFLHEREETELEQVAFKAYLKNNWFTPEAIKQAFKGILTFLAEDTLKAWASKYPLRKTPSTHTVGVVMAGNLPLVGFHDYLCILLSGQKAWIKLSSKDDVLLPYIHQELLQIAPEFAKQVQFQPMLKGATAFIATGSGNTARYFEEYFGKYPSIIRKNRNSVAVLTGDETEEELKGLAHDIFDYFGLGCRSVSKVYVPEGQDVRTIFPYFEAHKHVADHHRYVNNYDYYKSIFLVNRDPHYDNGFLLFQEREALASPISVLHYEYYADFEALKNKLEAQKDAIQCRVGRNFEVPFGQTQKPAVDDYADGVDTLAFLCTL